MSARARSIRICRNGRSPQRRCLNGSKNRIRPRFNAACPPSPAAGTPNGQIAGTSITVTCVSARSQDASATRLTLIVPSNYAGASDEISVPNFVFPDGGEGTSSGTDASYVNIGGNTWSATFGLIPNGIYNYICMAGLA